MNEACRLQALEGENARLMLRSGLQPPLGQTAKANQTANQISHRTRAKKRELVMATSVPSSLLQNNRLY